jgi:acetyl esterase/lipase
MVSAIFAATLSNNWRLLLARPRLAEEGTGTLFPPDLNSVEFQGDKDRKYGFHGYLYISHHSPECRKRTLKGADAVWLHAHGGGFYAGEARQYHQTYMRWVNKAYAEFSLDLRLVAVEYRMLDHNILEFQRLDTKVHTQRCPPRKPTREALIL